jgi:uncharacterized membrane protein
VPPNLHPLVVHFPIALLTFAVFCEIGARLSGRDSLRTTAYWNLVVGVLFAAAAVASGLLAEEVVPQNSASHATLESHETSAFITLSLFAAIFLLRVLRHGELYRKFSVIFLCAMIVAWLGLAATSYYGGELVYRHGVATESQKIDP